MKMKNRNQKKKLQLYSKHSGFMPKCRLWKSILIIILICFLSLISRNIVAQTNPSGQIIFDSQRTIMSFYQSSDTVEAKRLVHSITDFFNSAHYEQAITIVNRMIQKDSAVWPCYLLNAALYFSMKDYESCIRNCNIALEYHQYPDVVAMRGLAFYNNGNYSLARKDFDYMLSIDNKYYVFDALWSTYLANNNECTEAAAYRQKALQNGSDAWTYFFVSKSYLMCQQFDTGFYYLNRSIRTSKTLEALDLRSSIYIYQHNAAAYRADKDTILMFIDSLITLYPDREELYEQKFHQLLLTGREYKAGALIDKRLEIDSTVGLLVSKYYLLMNQDRTSDAEICLKRAMTMDSTNIDLVNIRIDLSTQKHDYKKTIWLCNRIIEAPSDTYEKEVIAYAYRKRGNAKYLTGDKKGGCEDISVAASLGDRDANMILEQTCNLIKK
jgi:tetratricopeptide (TPR) repeat protein